VDAARRRARQLGYANVEAVVMDAQDLDLSDGVVDAVLCRWTLYLLPDPALALREMARVVRPGGRVGLGIWAEAARNPLVPLLAAELVARGHLEPPPGETHALDLAPMLADAGLAEAREEEVAFTWRFWSLTEAGQYVADAGGEAGRALAGLGADARREVLDAYGDALRAAGFVGADGAVAVPAVALNALAVRPA
ncbi:MAG TPA: methyltransferase domain-containing protein, partial [Capillimicrobium sp.]